MAQAVMLEVGEVFAGRYKVVRLIAPGGMGAVFEARHLGTDRHVALKLLWPHVLAVESAREKFEFEAKVAARVRSEHIVHVLDAGFDADTHTPYLVMELLEGSTLAALVQREGRLNPAVTLDLLDQMARGLDAAHGLVDDTGRAAPIVHRDLKPENLLLCQGPGGANVIKILDFGIAKVLSESRNMSHEVRGTPLYMAYEQVIAGPLSPQTDVWALGLIAYYLLTGHRFWKSAADPNAGIQALFAEIVTLPIPSASLRMREQMLDIELPAAFDAWLARCLDRTPQQRFGSAGAAIRALEAALGAPRPTLGRPLADGSRGARAGWPSDRDRRATASDSRPPFGRRTERWLGGTAPTPSALSGSMLGGSRAGRSQASGSLTGSAASPSKSAETAASGSVLSVPAIERRLLPGVAHWGPGRWLAVSGIVAAAAALLLSGLLLRPSRTPSEPATPTTAAVALPARPAVTPPAVTPPASRRAPLVEPLRDAPAPVHPVSPERGIVTSARDSDASPPVNALHGSTGAARASTPRGPKAPSIGGGSTAATSGRAPNANVAVARPTSSKAPPIAPARVERPKPPAAPSSGEDPVNPFDVR